MNKIIPVICVLHANHTTTKLYEVPLCAIVKCGDKVVYRQTNQEMFIGTCISNANYVDADTLEMISVATHQELPLPKLIAKVKFENMYYNDEEEADI